MQNLRWGRPSGYRLRLHTDVPSLLALYASLGAVPGTLDEHEGQAKGPVLL